MPTSKAWRWFLILLFSAAVWLQYRIQRERVTPVQTLNSSGGRRALLTYHAAFDGFQREVSEAFARSLVQQDWRLDRTTTSAATPSDLSAYGLVILGVETYWFAPDLPTERYLRRLGRLEGKPVVVLVTGAGETRRAERRIREQLTRMGARVLAVQPFWILRPNDEADPRPNRIVALEQAAKLASTVAGQLALAHDVH